MAGIRPGLQRITKLLATTDLPWRAIHVGGTNGKGTVCAYISAMLESYNKSEFRSASGHGALRHGRFTSPHLVYRHDCISLDQQPISSAAFEAHERWFCDRNTRLGIGASNFEILAATAFRFFTRPGGESSDGAPADIAVIEVGMGGVDDATNILGQHAETGVERAPPLVTAFTKIGLDHQGFLGNTIQEIAHNKAGIMKPGVPVVYDRSNDPDVCEVLISRAGGRMAPTRILNTNFPEAHNLSNSSTRNMSRSTHTSENLSVAFEATWNALAGLGRIPQAVNADQQAALAKLAHDFVNVALKTKFPGRLQYLSIEQLTGRTKPVLLDGAHNAQSALVLGKEVDYLRRGESHELSPVTWVLAATDTKDVIGILEPLLRSGDTVFPVEFGPVDGMPWVRPMNASILADAVLKVNPSVDVVTSNKNLSELLRDASERACEQPLVIAGSLYLVGNFLRVLGEASARVNR